MIKTKLPPKFKAKWLKALRSGEFEQGTRRLHKDGKYCCIGVACKVAGYSDDRIGDYGTVDDDSNLAKVPNVLNSNRSPNVANNPLLRTVTGTLINLNDSQDKTFNEIADWVEGTL